MLTMTKDGLEGMEMNLKHIVLETRIWKVILNLFHEIIFSLFSEKKEQELEELMHDMAIDGGEF